MSKFIITFVIIPLWSAGFNPSQLGCVTHAQCKLTWQKTACTSDIRKAESKLLLALGWTKCLKCPEPCDAPKLSKKNHISRFVFNDKKSLVPLGRFQRCLERRQSDADVEIFDTHKFSCSSLINLIFNYVLCVCREMHPQYQQAPGQPGPHGPYPPQPGPPGAAAAPPFSNSPQRPMMGSAGKPPGPPMHLGGMQQPPQPQPHYQNGTVKIMLPLLLILIQYCAFLCLCFEWGQSWLFFACVIY